MKHRVKTHLTFLSLATAMLFIATAVTSTKELPASLVDQPVVLQKEPQALSDNVKKYLYQMEGERAKVWVFFTDKGVFTKEQFNAKASAVKLSEKVMKRRAKVGMNHVVFVDLPVVQD